MSHHCGPSWSRHARGAVIGGRLLAACAKRDAAGGVAPEDLPAFKAKAHELVQKEMAAPFTEAETAASAAHRDKLIDALKGMGLHGRAKLRAKLRARHDYLKKHPHKQHLPRPPIRLHPKSSLPPPKSIPKSTAAHVHFAAPRADQVVKFRDSWGKLKQLRVPYGKAAISSKGPVGYAFQGQIGNKPTGITYSGSSNTVQHGRLPPMRPGTFHPAHMIDMFNAQPPQHRAGPPRGGGLHAEEPAYQRGEKAHQRAIGGGNLNALAKAQAASIPLGLRGSFGDGHTTMRFPGGSARLSLMNVQMPTDWAPPLVSNFGQSEILPLENTNTVWPGGEDRLNRFLENKKAGAYIR